MVRYVDGCAALSLATQEFFTARQLPWLWVNGCAPERAIKAKSNAADGPIRFGYFGALAQHTGLPDLIRVFTSLVRRSELHICGFGKNKAAILKQCGEKQHVRLHGPRTPDECLQLAQDWDVLVNPRPIWPGNENNFPSKIFEYALSGRAILSSRVSGAEEILGPEAIYFDERDFDHSLAQKLSEMELMSRTELNRRGLALQQKLITEYSWARQGQRLAEFIADVLHGRAAPLRAASQTTAPT
jgi:glycosyltransferase involved in cell wall biosynthesis